jgi:phosphoglycolate phosphatase-like HAD superfamily hydrolase
MNIDIPPKEVFVFDWDGTLFDSMATKTKNFATVVVESIGPRSGLTLEQAGELYRKHSGKPRIDIFSLIAAERYLVLRYDEMEAMSARLSSLNKVGLADASVFADGLQFLESLINSGYRPYISSSVPSAELLYLVALKLPPGVYEKLGGVFGSSPGFSKGSGHLKKIMTDTGCEANACLMVGDDLADMELSREAGIDCLLVDREGRHAGLVPNTISTLYEVYQWLN